MVAPVSGHSQSYRLRVAAIDLPGWMTTTAGWPQRSRTTPRVCSRVEPAVPDPFGYRAAAGTRTTARQLRQRVFVVASVSKLSPQRLQVMVVVTAPIIAPLCAVEWFRSGLAQRSQTTVGEAYQIRC